MAPTLPVFQGMKCYIQYIDRHPYKPFFYPSNSYYGSNLIILAWIGYKFEDYTTQNCLEFNQDADHARIIDRRPSVSGIICILVIVTVC